MSMQPTDVMWMSKAPTVSELVGKQNEVTFKSAVSPTAGIVDEVIRPDFDTDVLWKPVRIATRNRTVSVDSTTDPDMQRKTSVTETSASGGPTSPVDIQPRGRRMSFTEMFFGSPQGGFSWGQSALQEKTNGEGAGDRKSSVTEDARFKELLKHQNKILGDDGISGGFKMRDYRK